MITRNQNKIKNVLTLAAVAMAFLATSALAATTTITGTAAGPGGNNDRWNNGANWDAGVPSGRIDAVVGTGVDARVSNAATPTYSGSLTLNDNSLLWIYNVTGSQNAVAGAAGITMNAGSTLRLSGNWNNTLPPIALAGSSATVWGDNDWQTTDFNGAITGAYTLILTCFNGHEFHLNAANSFSELIANATDRWILVADAAGSLGTGNVTINPRNTTDFRSAVLVINAANAMADTATLTLNGQGWAGSTKGTFQGTYTRLQMNADDTITALFIDGVQMPDGDYTGTADPLDWIGGTGTLTVAPVDLTLPDVDAGVDMVTWSGQVVQLDPNVVNNDPCDPQAPLTYLWSADPDTGVVFSDPNIEAPTVTITKATANPSPVTLKLAVTKEGTALRAVKDTMTIDVYDTACLAAKGAGLVIDPTDVDGDCVTKFEDFAVMATTWLDDYALTEPAAKRLP